MKRDVFAHLEIQVSGEKAMNRRCRSLVLLLALSPFVGGCNVQFSTTPPEPLPPLQPGNQAQQQEAFLAAKSIVHGLDRGEFDAVWDASSAQMKSMINKTMFTGVMSATRKNLGKPEPRGAPRIGFASRVDADGPEGAYAVLWIETNFGGKAIAEKVVLVKESGRWKLAGYFMETNTKADGPS